MKLQKVKLRGFIGIQKGMGLDEIEVRCEERNVIDLGLFDE